MDLIPEFEKHFVHQEIHDSRLAAGGNGESMEHDNFLGASRHRIATEIVRIEMMFHGNCDSQSCLRDMVEEARCIGRFWLH